jgi:hypothetical protein
MYAILKAYEHFRNVEKFQDYFTIFLVTLTTFIEENTVSTNYSKDFYSVDWFHGSALHGDQGVTRCVRHTNFSDESAA